MVNGGEPPNPLIPTGTNDSHGGRILDRLFAGLVSYDAAGKPSPEVAQSIENRQRQLPHHSEAGLEVHRRLAGDGPVVRRRVELRRAEHQCPTADRASSARSTGTTRSPADEAKRPTMSGLQVVRRHEFTVGSKAPTIDFTLRLGYTPFYPLPDVAFRDMAAFGRTRSATAHTSWRSPDGPPGSTTSRSTGNPTPTTTATADPKNKGLRFEFYANLDTAYADLSPGNLDVLDTVPSSALTIYQRDLGDNAVERSRSARQPVTRHAVAATAFRRRGRPTAPAWRCRRPSTGRRSASRSSTAPASRQGISPPARCRDSTATFPATTR